MHRNIDDHQCLVGIKYLWTFNCRFNKILLFSGNEAVSEKILKYILKIYHNIIKKFEFRVKFNSKINLGMQLK